MYLVGVLEMKKLGIKRLKENVATEKWILSMLLGKAEILNELCLKKDTSFHIFRNAIYLGAKTLSERSRRYFCEDRQYLLKANT